MANQVIEARTTETDEEQEIVPMNLRIELADGQLTRITATDSEGRVYTVSLKLRGATTLCCCEGPSGRVTCIQTDQCNCDPV